MAYSSHSATRLDISLTSAKANEYQFAAEVTATFQDDLTPAYELLVRGQRVLEQGLVQWSTEAPSVPVIHSFHYEVEDIAKSIRGHKFETPDFYDEPLWSTPRAGCSYFFAFLRLQPDGM